MNLVIQFFICPIYFLPPRLIAPGSPRMRPNDRNMSTQHIATMLGCARLATLLQRVVTCWVCLKMVNFEPTTPNMSQYVATGWPNTRKMLRPTMLRYVALKCCDRLAGV